MNHATEAERNYKFCFRWDHWPNNNNENYCLRNNIYLIIIVIKNNYPKLSFYHGRYSHSLYIHIVCLWFFFHFKLWFITIDHYLLYFNSNINNNATLLYTDLSIRYNILLLSCSTNFNTYNDTSSYTQRDWAQTTEKASWFMNICNNSAWSHENSLERIGEFPANALSG